MLAEPDKDRGRQSCTSSGVLPKAISLTVEDETGSRRRETAQQAATSVVSGSGESSRMHGLPCEPEAVRGQVHGLGTEESACPGQPSSVMDEDRMEMGRRYDGQGKKSAVVMANDKGKGHD